jgi:hypothetical protein
MFIPRAFECNYIKGTVLWDFFPLVFFFKQLLLAPVDKPSNDFDFFRIFAETFDYFGASPVSLTPLNNSLPVLTSMHSPVSMTPEKHVFAGVNDTGEAYHQCHWHRWRHASPVSLIPDSKYRQLRQCQWPRQCMHCRCHWHRWCTSRTFGSSPMHLKEQSVKKQAISRYYFSIASVQNSKESSNYNKIVCIAGVLTPAMHRKSRISPQIFEKNRNRY